MLVKFFIRHSTLLTRIVSFLWIVVLTAYVLMGTLVVPFHGDESTHIFMSRDYAYQFIAHDLSKVLYSETPASPTEQHLRLLNGTINKYLIGLAWHIGGLTSADINEQWDWGADWAYNQQHGHAPSEALLRLARWPSALLLAAGVVVMFALGNAVGGKPAAYTASLYYALNPALLLNGRRAMTEGSFIFFSLLVMWLAIWLIAPGDGGNAISPIRRVSRHRPDDPTLPHRRRRNPLLIAVGLGLAAGLAVASKHTAVFTVGAAFGGALVYLIYQSVGVQDDANTVEYVILPYLIIAAAVGGLTFYLLNPAWWGAPLERGQEVLKLREELLGIQTQVFGRYGDFGQQVEGFIRQVLVGKAQYYEVAGWEGFIADQIGRYEATGWGGVAVGASGAGLVSLGVALTAGVWGLMRLPGQGAGRWMVGVWAVVVTGTTLVVTPLEWQRYYLPVYPAVGLVAGVGVSWLLSKVPRGSRG